MQRIVQMMFGSTVYGTRVPDSDIDYKSVFLPAVPDLLLGRVTRSISTTTKSDKHGKNGAEDIDEESFSLQQYCKLLADGQTVAVDMLFVPLTQHLEEPHPIWMELFENRRHFLSRRSSSFVGYCRTQANKYGIKGSRVAALRSVVEFLQSRPSKELLIDSAATFAAAATRAEHIALVDVPGPTGLVTHLEVCDRKMNLNCTVKYALECYAPILKEYGVRTLQAENNEGICWKALMHAVRVANEAVELLATGAVTFPRPDRELLLQIRKGELPFKGVSELIDVLLETVERATETSALPEKPNKEWIDAFVLRCHLDLVKAY